LGSGDGTQANQQFALKHVPLTYLPAAGDSGDQAELQVRVNGILWSEVPALHQLDQHSQSYIVRRNADQQTRIIFGDGVHGARLPSGQENVVATYRTGLGPQGRVNANSLSLLQTRPLGVQSVNNPLAASGAAGPEKSDSARLNAPLMALTMDRVVALADYEHFVRSYAGIGAAQAALLWAGDTRLIHITVADADGNTLPNGIQLLEELRKALDRRRNRRQPLSIASYQPLKFSISAILFVDPHYQPALVQADVEQALRAYFSFRRRSLAQPAYAAEVIATAQAIPGIVAVDLDAMDRSSNGTALNSVLIAAPAHWDAPTRQVIAAQLLVLDQVILKTQVAS
jgi:predicted phage baseplate assembly protein